MSGVTHSSTVAIGRARWEGLGDSYRRWEVGMPHDCGRAHADTSWAAIPAAHRAWRVADGAGMDEYGERGREGADAQVRVARLERELEKKRQQTPQTAKLLLSATNYADSIRQRLRRDAELTLRKAREREARILGDVETRRKRAESELQHIEAALRLAEIELRRTAAERRQAEAELSQTRSELLRLRTLAHESRTRLSTLTTAALHVLNAGVDRPAEADTGATHVPEPTYSDLREALQTRLSQTADSARDARTNADEPSPPRTSTDSNGSSFGQGDSAS